MVAGPNKEGASPAHARLAGHAHSTCTHTCRSHDFSGTGQAAWTHLRTRGSQTGTRLLHTLMGLN